MRRMNTDRGLQRSLQGWWWAAAVATLALAGCGGGREADGTSSTSGTSSASAAGGNVATLKALGNRADLVSGGQALVEVVLPGMAKAGYADVRVTRNGEDVTAAFAVRANGRYMGLVQGLALGANTLVARVPNGPGARLEVTNHDNGGPVISGPQVDPWECTTQVANPTPNNPDLGPPLDAKCNIAAPVYRYQYRTLADTFAPYDPANRPRPTRLPA